MEKEKHDIKKAVSSWRKRLEHKMAEALDMDERARDTSGFKDMHEIWEKAMKMEKDLFHCKLTNAEISEWVNGLRNADGSTGPHWTQEQTTAVAKTTGVLMGHISPPEFWAAMNMAYSDYSAVADKFGINKPEFFAELAKAFLFDKDGPDPEEKLAAYVCSVAMAG